MRLAAKIVRTKSGPSLNKRAHCRPNCLLSNSIRFISSCLVVWRHRYLPRRFVMRKAKTVNRKRKQVARGSQNQAKRSTGNIRM